MPIGAGGFGSKGERVEGATLVFGVYPGEGVLPGAAGQLALPHVLLQRAAPLDVQRVLRGAGRGPVHTFLEDTIDNNHSQSSFLV